MRLETTEKEVEKYLSIGNYYVSYYRVLNTLGIENLHETTVTDLKNKLDAEKVRAAEELKKAREEFEAAKQAAAQKAAAVQKADAERKPVDPEAPAIPADPTVKNEVK